VIKTKQGKPMAFIELDDGVQQLEVTLFTDIYQAFEHRLNEDVLVFKLVMNHYKGQSSFVVDRVLTIDELEKGIKK